MFVLAASVRAPLPGLGISNGLFPGLAGVVKALADEHGPAGVRVNGVLPVRIATDRVRQLDALAGDPDEVRRPPVAATFRCAVTASPRNSAGQPRSCSPRPRPTRPAL